MKQKTSKIIIPSTGVAVNKNRYTEGSPLIRLTGDEFCTVSESALYNINDLNSDNGGGVLTNAGTVVFALDTDLGETVGTYNGSSQYLHRATEAQFEVGTGSFTSSIQFKTTDTGSIQTMFMYGDEAGTGINWMCGINASDKLFTKIDDNTTSLTITESIAGRWSDGKWHTAVMLWNPAEGSFLFCDGQLVASQTTSLPSNTLTNAGEEFYIGVDWSTSALDHFTGQLANFHLIKSADYNAIQVLNQGTREAVVSGTYTLHGAESAQRFNNQFQLGASAYTTTVIDVEEGLYEFQGTYEGILGTFTIEIDGVQVVSQATSASGNNVQWSTTDIPLSAGKHIFKIDSDGSGWLIGFINIIKRDGHENGGCHKFLLLGDEIKQRAVGVDLGELADNAGGYNNSQGNVSGADGDYREGDLFLKGGIWRIDYVYVAAAAGAKTDLDFGNIEVLDQLDTYNASSVRNSIASYTVRLPQGKTNVRLATNGRNASNTTDWKSILQYMRGERVGE